MSSRRLEDLTPEMELLARRFIKECEAEDFDVLIYCTYRSPEEQAVEYCKGRNQDDIKGGIDKLISLGMDDNFIVNAEVWKVHLLRVRINYLKKNIEE